MSFFIDEIIKEKNIRIFVKQNIDEVLVMGEDYNGKTWLLFSLHKDGTFKRIRSISNDIGVQTDDCGRIKETH